MTSALCIFLNTLRVTVVLLLLALSKTAAAQDSKEHLIEWYLEAERNTPDLLLDMAWDLTAEEAEIVAKGVLAKLPRNTKQISLHLPTLVSLPEELADFTNLQSLEVFGDALEDVSALEELLELRELALTQAKIESFSELGSKPQLTHLYLENSTLNDWSGVEGLPALELLMTPNGKLEGQAPLRYLPKLKRLNLSGTRTTSLGFSREGPCALERLDISRTQFSTISGIQACHRLAVISANETMFTSLEAFSDLPNLKELNLNGAGVLEIGMVSGLEALSWLDLSETPIETLNGLDQMPGLSSLYLFNTNVSDPTPAFALGQLKNFGLSGTEAADHPSIPLFQATGVAIR